MIKKQTSTLIFYFLPIQSSNFKMSRNRLFGKLLVVDRIRMKKAKESCDPERYGAKLRRSLEKEMLQRRR